MTIAVNIVGCSRNNSAHAADVSRNIRTWATAFHLRRVLIVEGPSTDGARPIWARDLETVRPVFLEAPPGLDSLARTDRIAALRNVYLAALREDPEPAPFTVVMDFDNVNACEVPPDALADSFAFLNDRQDRAACFAVQDGLLYDIYALRHPVYSPDDCWERVENRPMWMSHSEAVRRYVRRRQKGFPTRHLTEVESAFGGLGIYKTSDLVKALYRGHTDAGTAVCEHVELHAAIRASGRRLFVAPWLVNALPPEHCPPDPGVISIIRVWFNMVSYKLRMVAH
jgi:hypothetical protein